MPHKLLIQFDTIPSDDHNGYLAPGEVVRGESSAFLIRISNLEAEPFPGGEISNIKFKYAEDYAIFGENYKIGELAANSETVLDPPLQVVPFDVGLSWIELTIASSDGEPIECYQNRVGESVGTNSWSNIFYSVSREQVAIIGLLKNLTRQAESD